MPCNIHFSSLTINRLRRRKYKRLDGHTHVHWLREQMMRSMFCDLGAVICSHDADKLSMEVTAEPLLCQTLTYSKNEKH